MIGVLLVSSIAVIPISQSIMPGHRSPNTSRPKVVPTVVPTSLVTDVNATYSFSINASGQFDNATIYFGDGTSLFVSGGGTGTTITASHVFKNAGFFLIWYIINYPSSQFVGTSDLIPVEVLNTQLSLNASLGMLVNLNDSFMKTPGSNASFYIYYNDVPMSGYSVGGQNVYQVYHQYLAVEKAGFNGIYKPYSSRNFGYTYNLSTGSYGIPFGEGYYNMTSLQSGFYQLRLSTATALVNQTTGALGGVTQNTTDIWDLVVNSSASASENYGGQLFSRIESTSGNLSFDPQIAYSETANEILSNTMQQLVAPEGSSSSSFFPELLSALPTPGNGINNLSVTRSISVYTNGKWATANVTYAPSQVYTFTIRSNATWQDGTPVNSWDAAFSIIRDLLYAALPNTPGWLLGQVLLPGNYYQSVSYQNITNNVTWSNATDTLTLYLQQPTPALLIYNLLSAPGTFVIDANWAYSHGAELNFSTYGFSSYEHEAIMGQLSTYLYTHVMSDGPYLLTYNVPGNIVYLTSNPNYHPPAVFNGKEWAPAPSVGNIQILYTTNNNASFLKFASGEVQSISQSIITAPAEWHELQNMSNVGTAKVDFFHTLSLFWYNFNALVNISMLNSFDPNANLPAVLFDSLAVRQAFAYAFQYDKYVNQQAAIPYKNSSYVQKYAGMLAAGMTYNQSIAVLNSTTTGVPYFNLTKAQSLWAGFVNSSMGSAMGITYNSTGRIDLYNGKALNIPIFIFSNDPVSLAGASSWASYLGQVIPGLQTTVLPTQFPYLIGYMVQGQNPMPVYELGWAPDYIYPTDYLQPMALPVNGTTYPGPNDMTTYWFNGNPGNQLMGQSSMVSQANNMSSMIKDYQNATVADVAHAQHWFQAMNEMLVNMTFYVYIDQAGSALILSTTLNLSQVPKYEENIVLTGNLLFNFIAYGRYSVEFTQTGLPTGSAWFVNFTNYMTSGPITGSSYSVPLTNGTYAYTVSTTNFSYNPPPPGRLNVNGGSLLIVLTFVGKQHFNVMFSETGLGSRSQWYVNISSIGSSGPLSPSTNSYNASLTNGSYSFTVSSTNKSFRPIFTSKFTVNGVNLTIPITFATVRYSVVFDGSGLPSGTPWNVTVQGTTKSSLTNSITFNETNGSYAYNVQGKHGYSVTLSGGFTVAGSALKIPVVYSKNATVYLSVLTPSALLTIDGVPTAYGSGSIVLSLQQGSHFINVSKVGYQTFTDLFYFGPSVYYVNITLVQLTSFGFLVGTVNPSDAYISASGISVAVINGQFNQSLSTGSYYVSVEAQGYASANHIVNITSGHTTYLNVSLLRINQSYTVSGTVYPGNSSVLFGQVTAFVNSTGFYTVSLAQGVYNYSVTDNGYFPATGSIDVTSDLTLNFNLAKEPPPQSVVVTSSIKASGYNVTITNITNGNGNISVTFNASVSGTLVVQIPYSQIKNATISEVMSSKVYVNGTAYSNFSIALSNVNGTFSVILTVYGLKGDPVMEWAYSPSVIAPAPSPSPAPQPTQPGPTPISIPWYAYVIIGDAAVVIAAVLMRWDRDRKK